MCVCVCPLLALFPWRTWTDVPLHWTDGLTFSSNTLCLLLLAAAAAAAAKLHQWCLTLCDPIDGSPPGSPVPGILQERILEWVAISFSNAWRWKVKGKSFSHVWLLATPSTVPTRLLRPWDSPGKSTGVGCHCLLRSCFLVPVIPLCNFLLCLPFPL